MHDITFFLKTRTKNKKVLLMMREFMSTEEALAFTTGAGGWQGSTTGVLFMEFSDSTS